MAGINFTPMMIPGWRAGTTIEGGTTTEGAGSRFRSAPQNQAPVEGRRVIACALFVEASEGSPGGSTSTGWSPNEAQQLKVKLDENERARIDHQLGSLCNVGRAMMAIAVSALLHRRDRFAATPDTNDNARHTLGGTVTYTGINPIQPICLRVTAQVRDQKLESCQVVDPYSGATVGVRTNGHPGGAEEHLKGAFYA